MNDKESNTQSIKKAIGCVFLIFIVMIVFSVWCIYIHTSLNKVLEYSLVGIPFGIILWSFIGSLIRIVLIIQSKAPIKFPIQWIVTRSCLSIFAGSAIALLISVFSITIDYSIIYVLVFLVGYSNFPSQLIVLLQNTMVQNIDGPLDEKQTSDGDNSK